MVYIPLADDVSLQKYMFHKYLDHIVIFKLVLQFGF